MWWMVLRIELLPLKCAVALYSYIPLCYHLNCQLITRSSLTRALQDPFYELITCDIISNATNFIIIKPICDWNGCSHCNKSSYKTLWLERLGKFSHTRGHSVFGCLGCWFLSGFDRFKREKKISIYCLSDGFDQRVSRQPDF